MHQRWRQALDYEQLYFKNMEYKSTLDWNSKTVTIIIGILFSGQVTFFITLLDKVQGSIVGLTGVLLFGIIMPIAIYVTCYLYRPIKYLIADNKLIVKRLVKDVTFDINEIKDAYIVKNDFMRWTRKTFGNGGLFGFYGEFKNDSFGDMVWYATQKKNYVMLETTLKEKIILTPDDINMVKEIRKLIGK